MLAIHLLLKIKNYYRVLNLITVGITAYQEGIFLEEAINSLLNQSVENWEAVIVLDGGADKVTKKIFENFDHKKFKKHSFKNNKGPYITRNKAIQMTKTKWYFHLDGDDRLPIDSLKLIDEKIKIDKSSEYIYGDSLYFNKKKSFIRKPNNNPEVLCQKPLFVGQSPITTDLYWKLGGYTKELINNNDWDFWITVYEKKIIGSQINGIIYERRVRDNSLGSFNSKNRVNNVKKIISRHPIFFNKNNRKNKALFKVHELKARSYKANGDRGKALEHAEKALRYGKMNSSIDSIISESKMSYPRYKIRRLNYLLRRLSEN